MLCSFCKPPEYLSRCVFLFFLTETGLGEGCGETAVWMAKQDLRASGAYSAINSETREDGETLYRISCSYKHVGFFSFKEFYFLAIL